MDFELFNGGSIFTLLPLTDAAKDWVQIYLPEDTLAFGDAICIEHRYIEDIVEGIKSDGLTLQ